MHASDVDDPPAVAFSIRDRMLLAEYRMLQRDRAPILLALDPASNAAAAQALQRIDASVTGSRDAIGHLRDRVPTFQPELLPALAALQAGQAERTGRDGRGARRGQEVEG